MSTEFLEHEKKIEEGIKNREAKDYYINCMDCGKFIEKKLWISKSHQEYTGAECHECLALYDSPYSNY